MFATENKTCVDYKFEGVRLDVWCRINAHLLNSWTQMKNDDVL
jgi:hypothetical protein